MKQQIRELINAAPFQPFTIRMADGHFFAIEHPELVLATDHPLTPVVVEIGRTQHMLNPRLIALVEQEAA